MMTPRTWSPPWNRSEELFWSSALEPNEKEEDGDVDQAESTKCDLTEEDDVDPARIVVLTPLSPRWAPTVVVLSNLAGTGVPSG